MFLPILIIRRFRTLCATLQDVRKSSTEFSQSSYKKTMNYQQSQRYAKITSVFNAIKDNKHSKFVVHGENKKQPISIGEK
jgi:hypothetical protein